MILNEKVIDYEVVVLIEIYNFGFDQFCHLMPFDKFRFQIMRTSAILLVPQMIINKKSHQLQSCSSHRDL
jgi:hypothetical protein